MTTESTIDEIRNSSPALWEAVCLYEYGEGELADKIVVTLSAADRRIFAEETADIRRKQARKAEAARIWAEQDAGRAAPRFHGPAAWDDDYEARILDQQDTYWHGEIV